MVTEIPPIITNSTAKLAQSLLVAGAGFISEPLTIFMARVTARVTMAKRDSCAPQVLMAPRDAHSRPVISEIHIMFYPDMNL